MTGKSNKASKAFVTAFTQKYAEIAARTPVYAQLRNCIDLAISAAFIQQQDYYGKAGWQMATFANEAAVPVETLNMPARSRPSWPPSGRDHVDDADRRRRDDASRPGVWSCRTLLPDEDGKISELRESIGVKDLPPTNGGGTRRSVGSPAGRAGSCSAGTRRALSPRGGSAVALRGRPRGVRLPPGNAARCLPGRGE